MEAMTLRPFLVRGTGLFRGSLRLREGPLCQYEGELPRAVELRVCIVYWNCAAVRARHFDGLRDLAFDAVAQLAPSGDIALPRHIHELVGELAGDLPISCQEGSTQGVGQRLEANGVFVSWLRAALTFGLLGFGNTTREGKALRLQLQRPPPGA